MAYSASDLSGDRIGGWLFHPEQVLSLMCQASELGQGQQIVQGLVKEVEGALRMWNRSEEKRKLRYRTICSYFSNNHLCSYNFLSSIFFILFILF